MNRTRFTVAVVAALTLVTACGSDAPSPTSSDGSSSASGETVSPTSQSVTLVAYDSFPESDTTLNDALDRFTASTGIAVELLIAGDTGTMLSKAALTAGNPEGDVMFGVDNTFLSRALDSDVFEPYLSPGVTDIADEFTRLVPNGEATPVDYGDVCVNYDIGWFADHELEPPTSLDDLIDPAYKDLLVVENPATSSPGLAFLLATIDEYGNDGWQAYWTSLRDNGVDVADSWTQAYYEQFTWAGGGDPLTVSYGSSPPAEVIFADPPLDTAPTGVVSSTCFRQIEYAGVLRGTDSPDAAHQLIDFLIGDDFQSQLALNLFVYPTDPNVELPADFAEYAVIPESSRTLDPTEIETNRAGWIDEWTELVLG